MALLLAYGGSLVLGGDSTLSGDWFIGYLVVFSQIIPPARSLSDGYFRVSKGAASLERLEGLFETVEAEELDLGDSGQEAPPLKDSLVFESVTFWLSEPRFTCAQRVGFDHSCGESCGVGWSSGSGKTTAAHLLSKFANPDSGRLLVDGTDLRHVSGSSWRARLAGDPRCHLVSRFNRREHRAW